MNNAMTLRAIALCLALLGLPSAASAEEAEERWTINMRDADIHGFIEQIANISGQTLILDPRIKGQVSVISQAPLNLTEVYQLFLSVMATHGYSVLTEGDQARIVPNADAKTENSDNGNLTGPDALETRLLQVQHAPVSELIPLIRPLVPQYAHLAAVASANALIISDRRANIERVQDLINQLDRASASDYSVYDMRHGWVQDIVQALQASLNHGAAGNAGSAQVLADSRSNRLIFLGTPQARARLLKLAQSLDTPASRSANTRVIRLRHGDAKSLATTLSEVSAGLKPAGGSETGGQPLLIRADEDLNALVLLAEPTTVSLLEDIVRQLDVPRAQVLVEAAIVEMSGDISDALGVQWAIDGRDGQSALGGVNFNNTGLSVGTLLGAIQSGSAPPGGLPDGAIVGIGNNNFGALITALSATGNSNLLSTPSLLTLDNQKAEILVGQNVPFQTGSYTTDAAGANNPFTTIERQDIGVSLKVTPHINEGATLRLEIEQEISSLAPSAQAVDLVTNKRSIKSTILADNGQVIVLGGLIQDDVTRSESKVPLLGDLPLIGGLFRSSKDIKVKRNLMVFLRPSVVRDAAGLTNLSQQKYQGIRVLDAASLLPSNPQQLFAPAAPAAAAVDLRPAAPTAPAPVAQPYAAPPRTLLEKPKVVDPAALGNGRGGESLNRTTPAPPAQPLLAKASAAAPSTPAKRYAIELISGTGEAYMQALLKRHPREPLRLEREQRDGQPWYRVFYGAYPDRARADRALHSLPSELPHQRAKVVLQ